MFSIVTAALAFSAPQLARPVGSRSAVSMALNKKLVQFDTTGTFQAREASSQVSALPRGCKIRCH